jgi:hypothetical protein
MGEQSCPPLNPGGERYLEMAIPDGNFVLRIPFLGELTHTQPLCEYMPGRWSSRLAF